MKTVKIYDSILKISHDQWRNIEPVDFPFAHYQFLLALEESGSLGARTGWQTLFLTVWDGSTLMGAMPLYSKTNSYGEYIYDFAWAQAHEEMGLNYYPKLVSAIPFTSATGPKILVPKNLENLDRIKISQLLLAAAKEIFQDPAFSSLHFLFITKDEIEIFDKEDFQIRHSFQYHWQNRDYKSFQDFLASFRSKRRNEALRERRQVQESGLKITRLSGSQLNQNHADSMYEFYKSTAEKKGGFLFLTSEFYPLIFESMKNNLLFVLAENRNGDPVAGAINFFGEKTLYGRNWGCLEQHKSLHLEVCYYQGIEFAIDKGLSLFEAGAQGEHKFQRGFLPRLTYSAHQIKNPILAKAIARFVQQEKLQIDSIFETYEQHTPYSRAEIKPSFSNTEEE